MTTKLKDYFNKFKIHDKSVNVWKYSQNSQNLISINLMIFEQSNQIIT